MAKAPAKGKATTKPVIDAQTLAVDYGFALSVLNSDPDLKRIFNQAVSETWSTDKFIAELRGTKWFQHASDTTREWTILQASDPGTASQRLGARTQTIVNEAAALGVKPSSGQLAAIARNSIMFGWTDAHIRSALAQSFKYTGSLKPNDGLAGQTIDQIRKSASDYLVPLSSKAISDWTERVLQGTATTDDFTEYAKGQAKSMFPTIASSIDKGVTVQQYADPYKQQASSLLGINPNDIDFTQDKWRAALDSIDPKSKERIPLSLADWSKKVKSDPIYGYDNSQDALTQAASFSDKLLTEFGFKG